MKVRLMHPGRDFDVDAPVPAWSDDLRRDLELDFLWDAMAVGDRFLRPVAVAGMLQGVGDVDTVRYRQEVLADCVRNEDAARELYQVTLDALAAERSVWFMPLRSSSTVTLSSAVALLSALADLLQRLHALCARIRPAFTSRAFLEMFAVIDAELDEDYLRTLRGVLAEMKFPHGMLISARVGVDGQTASQVLRRGKRGNRGLFDKTPLKRPFYSFGIPERDEAGFNALAALKDRSVVDVAEAAGASAQHVRAYFATLRTELGFYLCALNLRHALVGLGVPVSVPDVRDDAGCDATGLCDPCLALRAGAAPVGNDLAMADGRLLVITGANHGGKSTFLRALGVAQLMAQAGMFVAGESFATRPAGQVLTHWTREEDEGLRHGKLDEEMDRMSGLIDRVEAGDLVLCNESFASTNEAEGSQIALEVTEALVAGGVRVRFVTHLYDFARAAAGADLGAQFLRAPRDAGGERSYRLEQAPPLPTSYGVELYDRVFGTQLAGG